MIRLVSGLRVDGGDEQRAFIERSRSIWLFVAIVFLVCGAVIAASPIRLEIGAISLKLAIIAATLPLALFYAHWRFDPKLAALCDGIAAGSAFVLVGAPMTYIAMWYGADIPFWDARFLAMDRVLGLDWFAYLAFVDERPGLGLVLDEAYRSLSKQLIAVIVVLAFFGMHARLQVFLLAFMVGLALCALAAAFVPAIGIYNYLGVDAPTHHPHFAVATMNEHVAHTLGMRGPEPVIRLDALSGIIVFPSFHMALAVLFAWGFWAVPVLRWAALCLNGLMAAATPLSGGHYFVDLLAGAAIAIASLAAARWMLSAGLSPEARPARRDPPFGTGATSPAGMG